MSDGRLGVTRLPQVVDWLPWPRLSALSGPPLLLPYYHVVSDAPARHYRHLFRARSVAEFTRDVEWFAQHYQPIELAELVRCLEERRPVRRRGFLMTFDDGFREMHDVVMPILQNKGVPAVFFLTSGSVDNRGMVFHQQISLILDRLNMPGSGFLGDEVTRVLDEAGIGAGELRERLGSITYGNRSVLDHVGRLCGLDFQEYLREHEPYLTSDQVRRLRQYGFSIGSHSVDHPLYGDMSLEDQLQQTRDSTAALVDRYGLTERAFAFPHRDAGVTRRFFDRVFAEGIVKVTFGTGGMLRDQCPRHFQRFSMEKLRGSARDIVAYHCARGVYRGFSGRGVVRHP